MSELIVSKLLHAANAFLIQEFHIVAGIAIEEIVRPHTKPEQTYLLVCLLGIIIYSRDFCRCKGAVRTEICELIQITQSIEQCLVTTARETSDGTMVGIVDGAVVFLDIRHQVVDEVPAEHITTITHLTSHLL